MGTQINSTPSNFNLLGRDRTVFGTNDYDIYGGTRVSVQNGLLIWHGSPYTLSVSPTGIPGIRTSLPTDSPFGSATSALDTNLNSNFGYTRSLQGDVLNGVVSATGLDLPSDLFSPGNLSFSARISLRFHVGDDTDVGLTSRMTVNLSTRPDNWTLIAGAALVAAAPEFGPAAIEVLRRIGETLTSPGGNLCPGGMCPP